MILSYVDSHRNEIVDFLQKLVQTESVTGDESKIAKLVAEECRKDGLEAELVEPAPNRVSVVARYHGTTGKPKVMWYSHYDTLPPGDLKKWDHPPFSGAIAEGYLWGRGTGDNKTATCGAIMAFRAVKSLGLKLKGDLVFTHVCDEERGGKYGFKNLIEKGYGEGVDCLFYSHAGVPDRIGIAANGSRRFDILVKGKPSSTSRVLDGVNAIHGAAELVLRLKELSDKVNRREYHLPGTDSVMVSRFSMNRIHAYVADNAVPDQCELRIDRRFTPAESPEQVEDEIRQIVDGMKKKDPSFEAEVSVAPGMDLSVSDPNSDLVRAIQRCAEKVIGSVPRPAGGSHSSDHGFFNTKYRKPVASYGIGGMSSHSPNERIKTEDVILSAKVWTLLMAELVGVQ